MLPTLYVEAYLLDDLRRAYVPSPRIDAELLFFVVRDWDGSADRFEFGPDEPHWAAVGSAPSQDSLTGFVEIFAPEPFAPISAHLELDGSLAGDLDFTACPPPAFAACP